ncbi:hypothetical protein [Tenacibaculum sp. 190524A05c]|uniref:Outer membrane beta-barrel porin/alpha-amylase n=1 Tax=Tenacibaculum platacis TaxID=3137852 RepID=A0ABM9P2M3_9FLAO
MSSLKSKSIYQNLIILTLIIHFLGLQAQIENLQISKEVTVDKLYAGLLSNTNLNYTSKNESSSSSFQFGARVKLKLIPQLITIRSFGVFKSVEGQQPKFFKNFETIITPNKSIAIHFGVMATPTTELRPNPTTSKSQIETNAEKTILGGKPGIKFNYLLGENYTLSYGVHNHNNHLGQHFKLKYKRIVVSSFFERNKIFLVGKWKFKKGNILITHSSNNLAFSTIIPITSKYSFYLDSEYDANQDKQRHLEFGVRRLFTQHNSIKGFLSIRYNTLLNNVQASLFIHI